MLAGSTPGSSRYALTGTSLTMPAPYCPRTVLWRTSVPSSERMASSNLSFSVRTASAANEFGGPIAMRLRSWKMWFGTMSRRATGRLVKFGAPLHSDGFCHSDLDMVDVVAIPYGLEDPVGEAQDHDVLDRLLTQGSIR